MRKLILLAVLLMVAFAAVPASASVQNVKVSGFLDEMFVYRENFDLGLDVIGDETQSVFITQTAVQVDADLTDQVSTTVSVFNERAWADDGAEDDEIVIGLAYVTLREMLYSPLTVIAGKQGFHYGNSFIVDAIGPNNTAPGTSGIDDIAADLSKQRTQDAIRLILDYNPLTLELLFSKVNARTTLLENDQNDDVDLYGINSTYELGDDMNTQVEAYFFAKIDKGGKEATNTQSKSDTVYVPGFRASTNPIEGLNVQAEVAWQRGNRVATTSGGTATIDNERRDAMGAQFIANYKVPIVEEYKPVAQYVYTYVSGDSNPDDRAYSSQSSTNKYTAWDPLYENQGGGTIYNTLFDLTNAHIHVVSLQANPIEDVTTKVSWTGMWLDNKIDDGASSASAFTVRQPDATTFSARATQDTEVGHEIDFEALYDYTEDVQFGLNLGWFLPGDLFVGDAVPAIHNDDIASQAIVKGNVNF